MASFAELRSKARSLETELSHLLEEYASFSQSLSSSATEAEVKLISQIEENMEKVSSF